MRQYLVAAVIAALSLTGLGNTAEAQTKVKGKVVPSRTVTTRVVTQTSPTYRVVEHRYYQPYTGFRREVILDKDLMDNDRLIRNGIEYRRTWVPGFWNENDEWVSGHYSWTNTEE